jgi:hypothetical protein
MGELSFVIHRDGEPYRYDMRFEHTYWFLKRHCILHFTSWYDVMKSHSSFLLTILLIVAAIVNVVLLVAFQVSPFNSEL